MKKLLLVFLGCALIYASSFCQQALKGRVIASDTRKPVPFANVFLSNTAVGTVSSDSGQFTISSFPDGRFDLVVSCMGYETYTTTVQSTKLPPSLEITLTPKVNMLQEVIVEPYEKNGWEKWGTMFMENFIGTSENARDCKLLNPDVVQFRFSKKNNLLEVFANDILLIENRSLGYKLKYDLIKFQYDFSARMLRYQGYVLFEDIETERKGLIRRREDRRQQAYYGSMMHFMRSLYRNRLIQDGFEVRTLIKISDAEKKRVRTLYQQSMKTFSGGSIVVHGPADFSKVTDDKDSAEYYGKVMKNPDALSVLINTQLPGDSIAFAIDSVTAGFEFPNHLQVIYRFTKTPPEYRSYIRNLSAQPLTSEITLPTGQGVLVLANGSFFEGTNLVSSGFWAWSEKIANMLPFDYWPNKK